MFDTQYGRSKVRWETSASADERIINGAGRFTRLQISVDQQANVYTYTPIL